MSKHSKFLAGYAISILFLLGVFSHASPLEEELQKLREAGIPTTIEELNLPDIPDEENGALVYREAFAMIDSLKEKYKGMWQYIPAESNIKWKDVPEDNKEKVADLILRSPDFTKIYQLLEKASGMECQFYSKKDYEGYVTLTQVLMPKILSDMTAFRKCQRILMYKAKIEAESGEINKSLTTILMGLKLARASSLDVPTMTSQLARIAVNSIALGTLEDINKKGNGNEVLYQKLIKEIEKSREEPLIYSAFKNETFIFGIQMYEWQKQQASENIKDREITAEERTQAIEEIKKYHPNITEEYIKSIIENPEKLLLDQKLTYLKTMYQVIHIIKGPYWKSFEKFEDVENELKKGPTPETAIPLMLLPQISKAYLQETRNKAYSGAAQIGIANRIYRQKHGEFVNSLNQLTMDILPSLPLDPFTGKDYIYRKTDTGFIVYSVGDNLKDDGGVSGEEMRWRGDFDIVWEIN
jgi:hypothetical protein